MSNSKESNRQREYALEVLVEVLEKDRMSHLVIREVLNGKKELTKTDRAFITRLCEGTIERLITLDYVIDCFSKTKVKKMKPLIRELIRMSTYQILFMDSVPDSAACNEAVKIAKNRGFFGLSGFVNGVLRSISRGKDEIKYPDTSDRIKYLSVKYSVPGWIIENLINDYGIDVTKDCLTSLYNDDGSRLSVRVNTSKAKINDVINLLKAQNIDVMESKYADSGLILSNYDSVEDIDAFRQGLIQIQDISSMLVGQVSGVKDGDVCIDVCAAPGGKTMHIADLNQKGKIIACDVSEYKVSKITENIDRNKYSNVVAKVKDATEFDEELEGTADLVIADVPCSGLGIIGKKTDIKYRVTKEGMSELVALSKKILSNAVRYLKPGGTLMFSTCTMNKQENEEVRNWIIDELHLKPVSIKENLGEAILKEDTSDMAKDGHLQMFITDDHDGFYLAKFKYI